MDQNDQSSQGQVQVQTAPDNFSIYELLKTCYFSIMENKSCSKKIRCSDHHSLSKENKEKTALLKFCGTLSAEEADRWLTRIFHHSNDCKHEKPHVYCVACEKIVNHMGLLCS